MASLARMLLVVAALLSGGVHEAMLAAGDDACCPAESSAPEAPDCPPGSLCACCPARAQLAAAVPEIARGEAPPTELPQLAAEPVADARSRDIFHPPRA